ncbi:TIGR04197 family type VII secretion effector [Carnobacterium gallinarum]|uniref:TIGR04197 family type VII secretion effector n=1 Tax=Carnobacterium gallinarum TaxID=2749 RepID=UPI000553B5E6|nr:TIGR04197 family type VII secretion effector [Carnobacterium gallinarum]
MVQFQSDLGKARTLATNLVNATSSLNQMKAIQATAQTTLQGNQTSDSIIQRKQCVTTSFGNALIRDVGKIQSVAASFEALDTQLKQGFNSFEGSFK